MTTKHDHNDERGKWDTEYADRNDWCIECGDLFNRESLKEGLCQRCRYLDP